jgi:hypothetical protein
VVLHYSNLYYACYILDVLHFHHFIRHILIDTAGKSHTNIIFTQCATVSGTKIYIGFLALQDKYKSLKCVNYIVQVNTNRQHVSPSLFLGNPLIPIPLPQAKFVVSLWDKE